MTLDSDSVAGCRWRRPRPPSWSRWPQPFGHGRAATAPLWSDSRSPSRRPRSAPPTGKRWAQVLKPAVVNVSMKRTAQAPEAADPFFQQFFGRAPAPAHPARARLRLIVTPTLRRHEQSRGRWRHRDPREARGWARAGGRVVGVTRARTWRS